MKLVTAIIGDVFIFLAVLFILGFVVSPRGAGAGTAIVAISALAGLASFLGTIRRT